MKKRILTCITLAVMALTLAGCNKTTPDPLTKTQDSGADKTYRILFIGNSYTYYNDMPNSIFENFAKEAGYQVEVTTITKGAHKLSQFADPTDEYGAKVEQELTSTKKYDFVVLQEQSVTPAAENAEDFYGAVQNLSERIRSAGATPMLYSTWGRKEGSSTLDTYAWTNESMTWKLAAAYKAVGERLNIPVINVGLAFYDVYNAQKDIELYNDDKSHPSYEGSYLAAATLFAGIFNADPCDIAYTGDLSAQTADTLCKAAKSAAFAPPSIPAEYQTAIDTLE